MQLVALFLDPSPWFTHWQAALKIRNEHARCIDIHLLKTIKGKYELIIDTATDTDERVFETLDDALKSLRAQLRSDRLMHYGVVNINNAPVDNAYVVNSNGPHLT